MNCKYNVHHATTTSARVPSFVDKTSVESVHVLTLIVVKLLQRAYTCQDTAYSFLDQKRISYMVYVYRIRIS